MMRALAATLALTLAAAVPAAAAPAWHDAEAGVPAAVAFRDVVAGAGTLIAVGTEAPAVEGGPAVPAIYRRAAGGWWRDATPLPAAASGGGELRAVAVSAAGAWAVGSWSDGTASYPLVLRLAGAELGGGAVATWNEVAAPELSALPLAVALADVPPAAPEDPPTATGAIGAADGRVHRLSDAPAGVALGPGLAPDVGGAGPVTGVSVAGDGAGYAVADEPLTGRPRFFAFDAAATALESQPALSADAVGMRGVASLGGTRAVAIDGARYWETDGTRWTRATNATGFGATSVPADAAIADVGGMTLYAIAGTNAGAGAVWRRTGAGVWERDDAIAPRLNAVAIDGAGELWAAGDGGRLLRRWDKPAPPPQPDPPADPDQPADPPDEGSTPPAPASEPAPAPAEEPEPAPAAAEEPAPAPAIEVSQPPPPPADDREPARPRRKRPLLRKVVVRTARNGDLIVTFTLARAARVALEARRGQKLVGSTRARTLRAGRRQLVLRYSGRKLPTKLKIIARPAGQNKRGTA